MLSHRVYGSHHWLAEERLGLAVDGTMGRRLLIVEGDVLIDLRLLLLGVEPYTVGRILLELIPPVLEELPDRERPG